MVRVPSYEYHPAGHLSFWLADKCLPVKPGEGKLRYSTVVLVLGEGSHANYRLQGQTVEMSTKATCSHSICLYSYLTHWKGVHAC